MLAGSRPAAAPARRRPLRRGLGGHAKLGQNGGFQPLHGRRGGIVFVVVAGEMKHAVDHQVTHAIGQRLAFGIRLGAHRLLGEYDVSQWQRRATRRRGGQVPGG